MRAAWEDRKSCYQLGGGSVGRQEKLLSAGWGQRGKTGKAAISWVGAAWEDRKSCYQLGEGSVGRQEKLLSAG